MAAVPTVTFRPSRSARFSFNSINLSGGYFPGWGLPCSLLIHQVPIILAIFLSTLPTPPPPTPPPAPAPKTRPHIQWMYFPKLPAVSQAPGGVVPQTSAGKPSPAAGSDSNGLVYPGPQEIVSDPPDPTNKIQTLIQTALKNAPILEPPLALPNLVLSADAGLAPPLRPLPPVERTPAEEQPKATPAPSIPEPEPPAPPSISNVVATASLPLKPAQSPDFVVSPTPLPASPAVEEEVQAEPGQKPAEATETQTASAETNQPKPAEPLSPPAPVAASDLNTMVALTPIPAASDQPLQIPAGEARGRFAISPKPNLAVSETEAPPTLPSTSKAPVAGIETAAAPAPGATAGTSPGAPPAAVSISFGSGPAVTNKPSGGGFTVTASGSGSASAPGKTSFAGITIKGGVEAAGGATNTPVLAKSRQPLQTSYGVSVISTESSGGGLPSFGLFSNHHIYTVYVDMRETETDSDPSWTLEVAIAQEPSVPGSAKNIAAGQGIVLPFPAVKERPRFPADLVRRHLRKMIIVYGMINAEGKMEEMAIKQTPDPFLNEPVLTALRKWVFRPAVRNGTQFATKVLLGIPVWSQDLPAAPPRHVSISTAPSP